MREDFVFNYPKSFPVPSISGLDLNSREEVQALINEVLPDILKWEENSDKAGLILEGMLEESLHEVTNRDEVKAFLRNQFQRRASTFNKISRGLEALKEKRL